MLYQDSEKHLVQTVPQEEIANCSSTIKEFPVIMEYEPYKYSTHEGNSIKHSDIHLNLSHENRKSMQKIIQKIKSQKPACDSSCYKTWRYIEKQHAHFLNEHVISSIKTHNIQGKESANINSINNFVKKKMHSNVDSYSLKNSNNALLLPQPSHLKNGWPHEMESFTSCSELNRDKFTFPSENNQTFKEEQQLKELSKRPKSSYSVSAFQSDERRITPSLIDHLCLTDSSVDQNPSSTPIMALEDIDKPKSCGSKSAPQNPKGCLSEISSHDEETFPSSLSSTKDTCVKKYNGASAPRDRREKLMMKKSQSTENLSHNGQLPATYKRGQLPKYLRVWKAEAERRLKAAAAVDPSCPPGHTLLPDDERINTLQMLNKGQADVICQLSRLPLAQDTLRVRKLRKELEDKLSQIEEGIQIFGQKKVYVMREN